jgi:serine/threonine protein kinase
MAGTDGPDILGQYKILDRIGAGGIGVVYRARDTRLGRTVAIKVVDPRIAADPAAREQFVADARASASVSHPNIAAVYEVADEPEKLYLAVEYVPGHTLRQVIAGAPLNPRRALDFAIQMADALADAHAAGVIHGDLKPDNVYVTPKGNAKLMDFGLARWTSGGAARARGAAETSPDLKTIAYLSPEQALGESGDQRTDIFSLGSMVFEMLTGKPPFAAPTAAELTLKIVQAAVPQPTEVNPALPRELDEIVSRAMSKSLDRRYESAASFAAELRSVAAILDVRSGDAEPPETGFPEPPKARRLGWIVALIVLSGIVALLWFATRM